MNRGIGFMNEVDDQGLEVIPVGGASDFGP